MGTKVHPLIRIVVALCATAATLSACGSDGGATTTTTADEVAQQEAQDKDAQEDSPTASPTEDATASPTEDATEGATEEAPAGSTTNADLDAYVAAGEKALRETFGGSFKKIYSDIQILPVYPSGVEYDYTFRAAVDPASAPAQLDAQAPTLRTQARTVVVPEMEGLGFLDPTVTYTYRNPDGSVVWTKTFS